MADPQATAASGGPRGRAGARARWRGSGPGGPGRHWWRAVRRRLVRWLAAAGGTGRRRRLVRWLLRTYAAGRGLWRRSLRLRMVTITLLVSGLLVGAFGYLVVELTTRSLLAAADRDAQEQVLSGAESARTNLRALGSDAPGLASQIRTQVLDPLATSPERGQEVTVVLVTPPEVAGVLSVPDVDAPVGSVLTDDLRRSVTTGVSRQIITASLHEDQANPVTYLVYGSPVPTEWPGEQVSLYYFFPLTAEVNTADNIRTIVLATGATLILLLAVVTGLVTRLVVRPVRLASRTAQRVAAGLLDQRMTVRGEDDLALLANSFNQMAGNLQRQIVRLEEMSRLQRRFTSDVSHELRTPLTTVRMAADLIFNERDAFPPEVARSAELLQHELDRFEALLTDLLEISRFDAGFAALDSEATDLVPVVRDAVSRLSAILDRAGVEVRLHLPDHPVIVEVDRRRLDRILRNLVENAVEHSERRPVDVTVAADRAAVAVTVRDHGAGMRPEDRQLVFNRFWRADPSRARQSGGTGLGLSISLEDARLHGGWLEAWGEPGQGAQFRLTLPLRTGERLVSSPLPLVPPAAPPVDGADPPEDGRSGTDRPEDGRSGADPSDERVGHPVGRSDARGADR